MLPFALDTLAKWEFARRRFMPLSYEAAREWAEEHLDTDEYEAEFGEVSEDEEGAVISCGVSAKAKVLLEREAAQRGETQSAVLERLLLGLEG